MNKKFLSIILSFAVVFSVVFMNFDNLSVKVNAGLDPDIDLDIYNNSQYFYIKNVRSGKYLTLQNNSTSNGTLIVQWHYNGGNNQKWRFEYFGNTGTYGGEYQIVPYNNPGKAIQMVSATAVNGVEARLATKANDTKQFFRIEKNYTGSRRFVTNASNFTKVLEIHGASVDDNAKLIHYSQVGNGSDQFWIEPVDLDTDMGYKFAEKQQFYKNMTYPNFNLYSQDPNYKLYYQQCNFVSQCMCASGCHYRNSYNIWNCNKYDFYQPTSFNSTDLSNHWNITQSWYKPISFINSWTLETGKSAVYTYKQVLHNLYGEVEPSQGSIVIISLIQGNVTNYYRIGYIGEESTPMSNCVVYFHNSTVGGSYVLYDEIDYIRKSYGDQIRVQIINP